jgi:two-component sensor histidine kinase
MLAQSNNYEYGLQWVDAKLGLNQVSVRNCVTDEQGFIWIATELGIFKYDGITVTSVKNTKYPEISNRRITTIFKENETGTIFFFTDPNLDGYSISKGKIERLRKHDKTFYIADVNCLNTEIIPLKIKNALPEDKIDKYNHLGLNQSYFNFLYHNYFYYVGVNFLGCIDKDGIETRIAFRTSKNTQFALCDNEIFVIDKNYIQLIEGNKMSKKKIAVDKVLVDFSKSNKSTTSFSTIFNSSRASYFDMNGKIYKMVFNQNKLSSQFLFDTKINNIRSFYYSEKEDVYLIGTVDMGLAIIKRNKLNTYINNDYPNINCNYAVVESNNNWYSYNGWQYNYKTNRSKTNKINDYYGNIRFLLNYKNKNYYEAKNKKLVAIEDLKTTAPIKFGKEITFFTSYTYFDKRLWVSTEKNISFLSKDSLIIDSFFNKYTNSNRKINSIQQFNGQLIVATTNGVYGYKPFSNRVAIYKGLEEVNARYIKTINSNSFWVGCYGDGLFLVQNNKAYKVIDENINLNTAHAIEEDEQGNLWISTNNGLLTINKSTLVTNTLSHQQVEFYRFSTEDGLLSNEFNGGGTHTSLHTKEGIVGFPSMKGFVWFQPKEVKKHLFSGSILIDKVEVNNKTEITLKNNLYTIPKEAELLTFNFSYAYYFNRENLKISYQFEDQKTWTKISGNSFKIGRYKSGIHKLKIRITTNGFDDKQGIVKTIILDFEPLYYESLWFWSLIALIMTSLVFISYYIGLNLKIKKEQLLKNKIYERTSELRTVILELEESKIKIGESLNEKNILLKEIHHRVKNNLQLVMSILNIQASDKENTSIEEFIEKGQSRIASMVLIHENLYQKVEIGNIDFKAYTESLVKNIKTTYGEISERITVHINMKDIFFNIQTSIPLGLIINELVTNSFKHGFPNNKAGQITIYIELLNETNYKLTIEDTGIGFPKEKAEKKSIGLELVYLLVLQLKGKLIIDSKNGTSHEIIFKIT